MFLRNTLGKINRCAAESLYRHIVTLDPNKFAEKKQRRLLLGNRQCFHPQIEFEHLQNQRCRIYYERGKRLPFPPDTKAFLYYSMSPERPRIAGELRLRVASSDDVASFESGSDLLQTDGQPWSRPLYILPKYYSPLYKKLREELVSDDLDTVLSTLPKKRLKYMKTQLLYTLNDTFIVDFSSDSSDFRVITEQGTERLPLILLFSDTRLMCMDTPYTGSALARFERSTLPEDDGTRTVVLRFLKIITPVKCVMPLYDGYICCPKEGELYRRDRRYRSESPPWSMNIDKSKRSKDLSYNPFDVGECWRNAVYEMKCSGLP